MNAPRLFTEAGKPVLLPTGQVGRVAVPAWGRGLRWGDEYPYQGCEKCRHGMHRHDAGNCAFCMCPLGSEALDVDGNAAVVS